MRKLLPMNLSPESFARLQLRHAIISSLRASIECSDNGNAMSLFNMDVPNGKVEVEENLHRFQFFKRHIGGANVSIRRLCFLDNEQGEFRKYYIDCSKVAPHVSDEMHDKFKALLFDTFQEVMQMVSQDAGRSIAHPGTTERQENEASFTYSRSGHHVIAAALGRVYDSIHAEFNQALEASVASQRR